MNVAPLAAVPRIVTRAEQRRHRRVVLYSWPGAIAGLVGLVAAVHFLVRPLDVLWATLLHRFGV